MERWVDVMKQIIVEIVKKIVKRVKRNKDNSYREGVER